MAIHYERLKARVFAPVRQQYRQTDCQLYALSLGLGSDPLDTGTLPYLYEGVPGGLRTLPTMVTVLGYPGYWVREPDSGIDWKRMVHGEQRIVLHQPLPAEGLVTGTNRVTHIVDKGEGKGAIVVVERQLTDAQGQAMATLQQLMFCRGDGGYSSQLGGQPSDSPLQPLSPPPLERAADFVDVQATRPESALLYRLLGDSNPLHADPAVARSAGFERPILHGLATYGVAAHALLRQCGHLYPGAHLRALDVRFTSPVYPGETLRTEIWRQGSQLQFQTRVVERDVLVLSHGWAEFA